jgi:hypothetical protein
MNIQLHNDYVYTRQLDLNLADQQYSAHLMNEYIAANFKSNPAIDYPVKSAATTKLYAQYNYFMYPFPGLYELYKAVKETFHYCCKSDEKFYSQAWLNVYRAGDYIDWHSHWPPEFESWHGFYCVDVEPDSSTTYRLFGNRPEVDDIVVTSQDNLLVISRSDGDVHRSSEWNNPDKPRITVAFDIIPMGKLYDRRNYEPNHWVPI